MRIERAPAFANRALKYRYGHDDLEVLDGFRRMEGYSTSEESLSWVGRQRERYRTAV